MGILKLSGVESLPKRSIFSVFLFNLSSSSESVCLCFFLLCHLMHCALILLSFRFVKVSVVFFSSSACADVLKGNNALHPNRRFMEYLAILTVVEFEPRHFQDSATRMQSLRPLGHPVRTLRFVCWIWSWERY